MSEPNLNRRDFVKLAAVGVATVTAMKAIKPTRAAGKRPESDHQWAMVIDQSKCIGCGYCTLACQAHNDINPDNQWNAVSEMDMLECVCKI